ncbi:RDD family protein [Chlorobium sp. KB01]|uniref:RDD family protein n=1 Tax=Chlorobium sp. KB01 TaxID=1917528 RepID=UPI0009781CBC|nr:RDD family protein [Chlorobium sp. KB01]
MTAWWYAEKEKKTGPLEQDELASLIQRGKIGPRTMLWKEGMESWLPLNEIEELQMLNAAVPPPLPPKVSTDPLTFPMATRWPRFFARIFDMWWETLLVTFVLGAVLGRYSAGFVEWINGPGASQLFGILCLPFSLILDAAIYRLIGNTPGKALLGLKVGLLDASPLSFGQYLSRNMTIWVKGLAFGFPLINLFTMAHQSGRLGKGQQASYDESTGYRVRAKPIGWMRKSSFGVAFLGLFVVMAVLNSMEQTAQREAILSSASENYSWVNPVTSLSAKIDSRWKNSTQQNTDGQQIYMFSERADRAVVILAVEHAPGFALDDYVQAFRKSTAANMRFTDGGRYFEQSGKQAWQGSGEMVDATSNRLHVQVVRVGNDFWRIVKIQTMPYEYSDHLVTQLQDGLWKTVF